MTEGTPARPWRRWVAVAGVAALAAAVAASLARLLQIEAGPLAVVVAFTPWFAAVALVALGLALAARWWAVLAAAALVLLLHGWWLAPLFTGSGQGDAEPGLVVATLNASYGDADAGEIVALVEDHGVDILTIQELTPDLAVALSHAGLDELLPFSATRAESDHRGIGLWSRSELRHSAALDDLASWALRAEVETAEGSMTVLAVHPMRPGVRGHAQWSDDLATVAELAQQTSGAMIIVGDLNTTRDHAGFRELERLGFADESDQAGSGLQFTFPEALGPLPLVAIDHVLVRDAPWVAVSAATVAVSGTDHRALVVAYAAQ